MHTTEVRELARVSYRQLDYWVALGYLHPEPAEHPGQGMPREWSEREARRARILAGLVHLGFKLPYAASLMDELDAQTDGIIGTHDGIVDLTLILRPRP